MAGGEDFAQYFTGQKLYGNDFSPTEIQDWYEDEREGYADLGARDASTYSYQYHAFNASLMFNDLPKTKFDRVLGFGSAYGDELIPILPSIGEIVVIDPSDAFVSDKIHGVPASYVKPTHSGKIAFEDNAFNLITCFAVLHHIPNVSFVLSEMARVLKPGGFSVTARASSFDG